MKRLLLLLTGLLTLGLAAPPASASTITFGFTGTPTFTSGLGVSVSATFTTLSGEVLISIVNNQANPTSVIQNLSDLSFLLSTVKTLDRSRQARGSHAPSLPAAPSRTAGQ